MIELLVWAAMQTKAAAPEPPQSLLAVRRIYIDRLNGGDPAVQLRDILAANLQNSKLFVITENPEKADATLKGSAEDLIFTDTFDADESITGHASLSSGGASKSSASRGSNNYATASISDRDSVKIRERRHEASAAVRLVGRDGDVIWATSKESLGGKFRGASADVSERITRQLVEDYEKARQQAASKAATPK